MNKTKTPARDLGMRTEYDFSKGIRGKYAKKFSNGTNIVALDPDVAKVFKDSKAVNAVLRTLAKIAVQNSK